MAKNFLTQIFGSRNDRLLKQYRKTVDRINALEPQLEALSDEALRAKTQEFRDRVAKGEPVLRVHSREEVDPVAVAARTFTVA